MLETHTAISPVEVSPSTPTVSLLWAQLTGISPAFSWHLAAATPSLGCVEGLGDRALSVVKASEAETLASVCRRMGKCTGHCRHPGWLCSPPQRDELHSPKHRRPLSDSTKPGGQTHWKLPGVLVHVPKRQMLGSSSHSLISGSTRDVLLTEQPKVTPFLIALKPPEAVMSGEL